MTGSPAIAPTFADPELQARFARDGYVVVDLIGPDDVAALRALFDRLDHPVDQGFFASNETTDVAYKQEMVAEVRRVLGPPVHALVPDHRLIGGYFVVKWPGPESEKGPHLDWSLVDEARFRSVSVWVPLVDTDEGNGALGCARGSHLVVGSTHRGSPDFPTRHEVEAATRTLPPETLERIDARAGQAVVYTHQTIHFSGPNLSAAPRPAVNIAAVPEAADLLHFRMDDDGAVEALTVDDGFFEAWVWDVEPPPPRAVEPVERIDTLPREAPAPEPTPARRRWWRR